MKLKLRQERINYAVKHIEAFKCSRPNNVACQKMRRINEMFPISEKTIAELQKIIFKKVKAYELLKCPLSTSKQHGKSRQNSVLGGSVGHKHVLKGTPVLSKDAATYQRRELKREKSLISVAPIVSQGEVEEQRLQIACFQERLIETLKRLRTESESSKQLAVAEQKSTCELSQTNPRSQSEENSVSQKEKSRDLEIFSLTEELQELQQQSFSFNKQREEYETQMVQTVVANQNKKLLKRKQKLLDSLN